MRGRAAALAATAALLAGVVPVARASGQQYLVVQGSRHSSIALTLPRHAFLDITGIPFWDVQATISGGHDLAGFVITDEHGDVVLYDAVMRVTTPDDLPWAPVVAPRRETQRVMGGPGDRRWYEPRRYTLTLLADAPVTVRIPVHGMPSRALRPVRPVAVTTARGGFRPTPTEPRGEARMPVTVRPSSLVLLYSDHAETGGAGKVDKSLCLVRPLAPCDETAYDARFLEYDLWCFTVCASVRDNRNTAYWAVLRPRVSGTVEAVGSGHLTPGLTTDGRGVAVVIG